MPLLLLFVVDVWGWTSYLVSESYFLAMILLLLSLPLLAEIADDRVRFRLDMQVVALIVVGILILTSKISVGVIYWAAAGFLLWQASRFNAVQPCKIGCSDPVARCAFRRCQFPGFWHVCACA